MILSQAQNDGKGVRLSSRSAPIRDLALLTLSKLRRCRIVVRHDGRGGKTAKIGTDGLLTSVPFFAKTGHDRKEEERDSG